MHFFTVKDWLLAEAFRRHEERLGRLSDHAAVAIARDRGADLPERIVERAASLADSAAVAADIARLQRALNWIGGALAVAGLLLGALAARAATVDRQMDILLATATLLLVPSLMLVAWLAFMALGPGRGGPSSAAGGLAMAGMRRIGPRLLSSPQAADVLDAFGGCAATAWGRWRLSAITHAFWLAYAVGALAALFVFFSVVQYDLVWGTTLLDDATVVALVEWLAWWPSTLGFMPEARPEWIVAGREGLPDASARAPWARFLLAMIAAWAIVPRAALLVLSLGLAAWSGRRFALDVSQPGYLRLSSDLAPQRDSSRSSGDPVPADVARPRRRRRPDARGVAVVSVEFGGDAAGVASLLPGVTAMDLGNADDRDGRSAALETVAAMEHPAEAVLVVCSMLRTPDAGTGRFLARLSEEADAPLWLWLDESGRLEARGGDLSARRSDWSALAHRAGGRVVFLDHDAPDAAELARLNRGLRGEETEK